MKLIWMKHKNGQLKISETKCFLSVKQSQVERLGNNFADLDLLQKC